MLRHDIVSATVYCTLLIFLTIRGGDFFVPSLQMRLGEVKAGVPDLWDLMPDDLRWG